MYLGEDLIMMIILDVHQREENLDSLLPVQLLTGGGGIGKRVKMVT